MDTKAAASAPHSIAAMIGALGTDSFEAETLRYLYAASGVEHFCVYRIKGGKPAFLSGASIRGRHAIRDNPLHAHHGDRSYAELFAAGAAAGDAPGAVVVHDDLARLEDRNLREALQHFHIVDRVTVCGRCADDVYAVSLLRSDATGQFGQTEIDRLTEAAEVLIAVCAKHAAVHWDRIRGLYGFSSVKFIEDKLRATNWRLSQRELQVAARILFGISTIGIALDLGLSEETVATYRKRVYCRLSIGSRHELFRNYLALL